MTSTETTQSTTVLTIAEALDLARMRKVLDDAKSRVSIAARSCETVGEASDLGRLAHALATAENALFDVLNQAKSYCDCTNAASAIDLGLRL